MGDQMYQMLLRLPVLLIAITVHEYAHARVAYSFGDPTAKLQGRLSLNPLVHLDPVGALMLLIVGIGWAKPVPINPYNFKDYRSGMLGVSLAGPLANFILAFFSLLILKTAWGYFPIGGIFWLLLHTQATLNTTLGVFNLIPLPPLDGSKIFSSLAGGSSLAFYRRIEPYAPLILLVLIFTGTLGRIVWPVTEFIMGLMIRALRFIP